MSPIFCFSEPGGLSLASAQASMIASRFFSASFGEGREDAVAGAILGNLGRGEPGAVHGAEQIVLRPNALVEMRQVDAAGKRLGGHRRLAVDSPRRSGNHQRGGNRESNGSLHRKGSSCLY